MQLSQRERKNEMDCYCKLMFNHVEKLNPLTHQFCFKFTGIIIRDGSLAMEDESLFISFSNIFLKYLLKGLLVPAKFQRDQYSGYYNFGLFFLLTNQSN